ILCQSPGLLQSKKPRLQIASRAFCQKVQLRDHGGPSKAPISHAAPTGRATPRWSVATMHGAASIAGLPATSACVLVGIVGPPLSFSVGDKTLVVVTPAAGTISVAPIVTPEVPELPLAPNK